MMGNPYITNRKKELKTSVVAFLDLLGFSEVSKQEINNGNGNHLLSKLLSVLRKAAKNSIHPPKGLKPIKGMKNPYAFKMFTDNIVIGFPIHGDAEHELGHTFYMVALYQLNMAVEGFFVRGGLDVGLHYMDNEIVFGDALIETYNMENKKAIYPRVILSENVNVLLQKHLRYYAEPFDAPQNIYVAKDSDGHLFINYLGCLQEIVNEDPEAAIAFVKKHQKQVMNKLQLYRDQASIYSKYVWVGKYHNFYCNTFLPNYPKLESLLVQENLLSLQPELLVKAKQL